MIRTLITLLLPVTLSAAVITYGDKDCLGQACYGASEPTDGATLQGLAPGSITLATNPFGHVFPFSPGGGEFAGTDQIWVGSVQTGTHDGYAAAAERLNGPAVFILDYSSLIPLGQTLATLTLGIAADDFQAPAFGQLFTASINGGGAADLATQLNALAQGGPVVQFFTIGLNPSVDPGTHILTLSIDEGGDGGDGFAADFLTIGVTTVGATPTGVVPEPATLLTAAAALGLLILRRRA